MFADEVIRITTSVARIDLPLSKQATFGDEESGSTPWRAILLSDYYPGMW